jgi:predicted O-methyltransferase YrrM
MALLVEILGAQKTIELGVFTGYSALVVAQSLPEHGKVIACDINDENAAIARQYWHKAGVEQKIELRIAPALETLEILLNQGQANTFDFAFIDADKGNYPVYYEKVLQLIRPGGLIAIDNMLWGGKVADPSVQDESTQVIRALNQQIQQDDRVTLSLVPIGDGLLLARKRI